MKNTTLGSSLLVAGTSIGAGMLALPLVAAATGFWPGLVLMIVAGGLSCYGGLLIAEACRAVPEAENLHGVVGRLLGWPGQTVAILAMLFLYYSLCSAYISAGASLLKGVLVQIDVALTFWQSAGLVALLTAAVVVIGTGTVDFVNRILFFLMLALLMLIIFSLLPAASFQNLQYKPESSLTLLAALPVLYTSFGFHCAVPTVVRYVKGEPRKFHSRSCWGV